MPDDHSPGFSFKEGKLYVFTETGVMMLETWPVLRALRKKNSGRREDFAPAFRVVQPYRPREAKPSAQLEFNLGPAAAPRMVLPPAQQRKRAFDSFPFSVPRPAAARAEKFQSRVFRLFKARAEILEFAQQNPALCFALANFHVFVRASIREATIYPPPASAM